MIFHGDWVGGTEGGLGGKKEKAGNHRSCGGRMRKMFAKIDAKERGVSREFGKEGGTHKKKWV